MTTIELDQTDRLIINELQGGFPLSERPFADAAETLRLEERDLIDRIERLVEAGALSRFGPLYNAEKLGGAVTLCAMSVPEDRFDSVADQVNAHREVAHNYARTHALNMWFVIAAEDGSRIEEVIAAIEGETGLVVLNCPKEREFFIGLKVPV